MHIICGGRRSGKTIKAIEFCHANNLTLVAPTITVAEKHFKTAVQLGKQIKVKALSEILKSPEEKYFFDEVESQQTIMGFVIADYITTKKVTPGWRNALLVLKKTFIYLRKLNTGKI